jgi:hypothetical protein
LNLFNSSFVTQQADAFAQRVTKAAGEDVPSQVRCVFELALQRTPSEEELTDAVDLVQQFGLPALCRAMFNSSEFLFIE